MNTYKITRLLIGGFWIELVPGSFTIRPFRDQEGFHAHTTMCSVATGDEVRYAVIIGPLSAIQAAMEAP